MKSYILTNCTNIFTKYFKLKYEIEFNDLCQLFLFDINKIVSVTR